MTGDRPAYLSFPDQLDHADVIEFSDAGDFGLIQGDDREIYSLLSDSILKYFNK